MIVEQAFGYWAPKPGSILADGSIVTGRRGSLVYCTPYGDVYLEPRRAAIAGKYGWEIKAFVRDDLVVVRKDPLPGVEQDFARYLLPPVGLP